MICFAFYQKRKLLEKTLKTQETQSHLLFRKLVSYNRLNKCTEVKKTGLIELAFLMIGL